MPIYYSENIFQFTNPHYVDYWPYGTCRPCKAIQLWIDKIGQHNANIQRVGGHVFNRQREWCAQIVGLGVVAKASEDEEQVEFSLLGGESKISGASELFEMADEVCLGRLLRDEDLHPVTVALYICITYLGCQVP